MKIKIIFASGIILLSGCNNTEVGVNDHAKETVKSPLAGWQPPAAGTVVDKYEERVTEDQLNEKYFRVTVKSMDKSKEGEYALKLEYGFNINETTITFPKWTNNIALRPIVKGGQEKYSCLIGFDAGDGEFHELYEVKALNGDITFKQIRAYYQTK
jgi:hypothetical protein